MEITVQARRGAPGFRSVDIGDLPMAELIEVIHGLLDADVVGRADHIPAGWFRGRNSTDDDDRQVLVDMLESIDI
jgi:hypothetical protein